jgi:hypothetical protein
MGFLKKGLAFENNHNIGKISAIYLNSIEK